MYRITSLSSFLTSMLVILVSGLMFTVGDARAQQTGGGMDHDMPRSIRVSGEGLLETPPDMAIVQFSIVTNAETPERARTLNGEASRKAMNAVRALGLDETELQMRTLRLQPHRVWNSEKRNWEERGFEATRSVEATVRDLDQLPQLVADIVDEGANRIDGVRYDLDDRQQLQREALKQAVADAKAKAEAMVEVVGASVGPVITIEEQGVAVPQPIFRNFEAMASKDASGEAEPEAFAGGLIEIRANVVVVFELN